jgi:hypothetical protein
MTDDPKFWTADAAATSSAPVRSNRSDVLPSAALKRGWALVALGALVPFLALWGAYYGIALRRERRTQGTLLAVTGGAVFIVRLALYLL